MWSSVELLDWSQERQWRRSPGTVTWVVTTLLGWSLDRAHAETPVHTCFIKDTDDEVHRGVRGHGRQPVPEKCEEVPGKCGRMPMKCGKV